MAIFQDRNGKRVMLRPLRVFGRRPGTCQTVLQSPAISLPSAVQSEVHIYQDDGGWVLEDADRIQRLQDGSVINVGEMSWELVVVESLVCTASARVAPTRWCEAALRFELSQDEEHARLFISIGNLDTIDLGERIHHYLLTFLARLRLRDAERGLDATSQGWIAVDELARMLAADASYI